MAAQILTDTTDTTLSSTDLIGDLTNLYSKKAWSTTGIGYASADGAGGTVTQATSKTTAVTINKLSGQITMNAAALAAGASVVFGVTNSFISSTDNVIVNLKGGYAAAGTYNVQAESMSAGSFAVTLKNVSTGSLSEAVVITFSIVRAATS